MIEGSNLSQTIFALSEALDLVGIDDVNHGKRVAYIALEISKVLNYKHIDLIQLFHASLLHDCGVSSSKIHTKLVLEFDWIKAKEHCLSGYNLLNQLDIFKELAPLVLFHHTHWADLKKLDYSQGLLEMSNLIFLADRIDITIGNYCEQNKEHHKLLSKEFVENKIKTYSDDFFKKEFVDAFFEVSEKESFWFTLEDHILRKNLVSFMKEQHCEEEPKLDLEHFKQTAKLFSYFVDAKSNFTSDHSMGVANLSRFICEKMGFDKNLTSKVEIAALLHDLGKLKIPDQILEKTGSLTKEEFNIIKYHPFETNKILSNINGIEDITLWASQHHEKLNGRGYPYHYSSSDIPMPSRIIAVADIFQALAQKRPYRDQLKCDKIMEILKAKATLNEIDKDVVKFVEHNLKTCWDESLSEPMVVQY